MVRDDRDALTGGPRDEALGQTGPVARRVEVRMRARIENDSRTVRRHRIRPVDHSHRDRMRANAKATRVDDRERFARSFQVERVDQLAQYTFGANTIIFEFDQRSDVGIEANQRRHQLVALALKFQ